MSNYKKLNPKKQIAKEIIIKLIRKIIKPANIKKSSISTTNLYNCLFENFPKMTTPTLQPQALLALQNLFQIWKQDNTAQNNSLCFTKQCIWLYDNNDITQTIDLINLITSFSELDSNNFLDTLIDTELLEINQLEVNNLEEVHSNLELEDVQEETLSFPIANQEEATPAIEALLFEKQCRIFLTQVDS